MQVNSVNSTKKSGLKLIEPVIPRFPPEVTALDLLEKATSKLQTIQQTSRIPNAFIAYRMAVCKELRRNNHPVITQPQLSSMAKQSWSKEPEHVRKEYQRIAAEARDVYKSLCNIHLPLQSNHEAQLIEPVIEETTDKKHTSNESVQNSLSQKVNDVSELATLPSPSWSNSTVGEVPSSLNTSDTSPIADFSIINESEYMLQYTPVQIPDENNSLYDSFDFHQLFQDYGLNQFVDESVASQLVPINYDLSSSDFYSKDDSIVASFHNTCSQPESTCEKCRDTIMQLENKIGELEQKLSSLTSLISTKLAKKGSGL
ncbi:8935_t:CDS:1 [Ambispora gerdemannii]|uniref:8935_t:CDS:1 n=1 Tax=Ambispora gerdemannii TaxID=144530 RepID=A0A9N8V7Y9_9GLOM|nr:8935_t:CDS:1 [Ambispora gerdemannii]